MPRRQLSIVPFCICLLVAGACGGLDMTGLYSGLGSGGGFVGCCASPAPPCTTTCPAMDPTTGQFVLLGDTIDIFYNANTIAPSWTYDSALFAAAVPPELVEHRGVTVSHIALVALKTGASSVKAKTAAAEGMVNVEAVPSSAVGGTGVTTIQCYRKSVTDPSCDGTKYPWDTASFKTGDTIKAVFTRWDRQGRIVSTRSASWSTSNPAVAIVSSVYSEYYTVWLPIVIAKGPGTATIAARTGNFVGSTDVTVAK